MNETENIWQSSGIKSRKCIQNRYIYVISLYKRFAIESKRILNGDEEDSRRRREYATLISGMILYAVQRVALRFFFEFVTCSLRHLVAT